MTWAARRSSGKKVQFFFTVLNFIFPGCRRCGHKYSLTRDSLKDSLIFIFPAGRIIALGLLPVLIQEKTGSPDGGE
jgi:hypothetical protein